MSWDACFETRTKFVNFFYSWHGDGTYEDCNNVLWTRNIMIRYKGGSCKWWHFYPSEEYPAVRSKFQEILAQGDNENGILSALLKSAKNVQIEAFGQLVVWNIKLFEAVWSSLKHCCFMILFIILSTTIWQSRNAPHNFLIVVFF